MKVEGGMFTTYRVLGLFNLLPQKPGPGSSPGMLPRNTGMQADILITPSTFHVSIYSPNTMVKFRNIATWPFPRQPFEASGMRRDRSPIARVREHIIGFYGAIDPFEGVRLTVPISMYS